RMCTAAEGSFAGSIQCPYHGWTYSLDGALLGAPHMEQSGFSCTDYPLKSVALDTWDGHIFLNFASAPRPLAAQLGDLPARFAAWRMAELRLHRRIVYHAKANW